MFERQNQQEPNLSVGNDNRNEVFRQGDDIEEYEGIHIDDEGIFDNSSGDKAAKRQKGELQGKFKKTKPPTFDGEAEEVDEA